MITTIINLFGLLFGYRKELIMRYNYNNNIRTNNNFNVIWFNFYLNKKNRQ